MFGSFATGLHLPTSDVDCVILESDVPDARVATALQGLGKKLAALPWVKDLEVRCHTTLLEQWISLLDWINTTQQ